AGRLQLDAARLGRLNRPLAVDRAAERVDDAAEQRLADGNRRDLPGALDAVAFANVAVLAHDRDADVVFFDVQHEAANAAAELDELSRFGAVEAVDARDAVADAEHRAGLGDGDLLAEVLNLVADDAGDFVCTNLHGVQGS